MHWKQSPRDHSIIRCPEDTQDTDKGALHAEVGYQQSCKSLKTLLKRNTSEGLLPMQLQHTHRKYYIPTPYDQIQHQFSNTF